MQRLLGDDWRAFRVFRNREVLNFLRRLSARQGNTGRSEHRYVPRLGARGSDIYRLLADGALSDQAKALRDALVPWMLSKRLLFRGLNVTCPRCDVRSWYGIGALTDRFTCAGCLESSTLTQLSTDWAYQMNELVASALDQGSLVTLFGAEELGPLDHPHPDAPFIPCVEVSGNGLAAEIDLVGFRGGRWVLAECKSDGSGGDIAQQVASLRRIASFLEPAEVVLIRSGDSATDADDGFDDVYYWDRINVNGELVPVDTANVLKILGTASPQARG